MSQQIEQVKMSSSNIVEDHKKMLLASGQLSEFQLKNLKTWPYIVFNTEILDSLEIHYNFQNPSYDPEKGLEDQEAQELCAGAITYNFKFKKGSKVDKEGKKLALDQLTLWTKFLFWKNTDVVFKRNGRLWT